MSELATRRKDTQIEAAAKSGALDVPALMQAIVDKGITPDSVAVMKDLLNIQREIRQDEAKAAFNNDFLALRKECHPIAATKVIPTRDGGVKGKFASLEDIMGEVSPLLEKYGFSDTYSQDSVEGGRTRVTVTLLHTSGHERSSTYTCREHSSPNNTPAQNDGGTNKMARRHALCNMLGIVLNYDADARLEGDTITEAEAADLGHRVGTLTGGDAEAIGRWLSLAGASEWSGVRRAKYGVVVAELSKQERAKDGKATDGPKGGGRDALIAKVSAWSGFKPTEKTELADACRSVIKAAGCQPTDWATAIAWVDANQGTDFFQAVKK